MVQDIKQIIQLIFYIHYNLSVLQNIYFCEYLLSSLKYKICLYLSPIFYFLRKESDKQKTVKMIIETFIQIEQIQPITYNLQMKVEEADEFRLATVVTKNNKTGTGSNKRLLVINRGHLYYYSQIPKQFKGDVSFLDTYKELPKCSIEILNIKKINGGQNNSSYFSIQFEAKHMMERDDIRKTIALEEFNFAPKTTKGVITWQFTCDNQFIKQKWVKDLQTLNAIYKKEKIEIGRFFNNMKKEDELSMNGSALRSSKRVPWWDETLNHSNSNENLRKSYLTNFRKSAIPSNSSQTGSQEAKKNSNASKQQKNDGNSEDIVEAFMKLEKGNQRKISEGNKSSRRNIPIPSPPEFKVNTPSPIKNVQKSLSPIKLPVAYKTPEVSSHAIQETIKEKDLVTSLTDQKNQIIMKFQQNEVDLDFVEEEKQVKETVEARQQEKIQKKQDRSYQIKLSEPKPPVLPPLLPQLQQEDPKSEIKQSDQVQFKKIKSEIHIEQDDVLSIEQELEDKGALNRTMREESPAKQHQYQASRTERVSPTKYPILMKSLKSMKSYTSPEIVFDISPPITFHDLVYFSCSRDYSFSKRIQAQKKLNSMMGFFIDKACKNLTDFLTSKNQPNCNRYQEVKISQGITVVDIGYVTFKLGYVSTQALTINDKQKIYYNEESMKQLKRQMKMYDKVFSCIMENIKTMTNSKEKSAFSSEKYELLKKLRIPLSVFIQYKGVAALAVEEFSGDIQQQKIVQKQQLLRWKEVFALMGLNSANFTLKKIKAYKIGECVVAYLNNLNHIQLASGNNEGRQEPSPFNSNIKNSRVSQSSSDWQDNQNQDPQKFRALVTKIQKNHNITFQSPLNVSFLKKAKEQNASISTASLLRYIKGVNLITDPAIFTCPKAEILTILEYAYLCKYLRKFYRAAQGEIDQVHFINLLLKGDTNILQLFESAGFQVFQRKSLEVRVLGIFFELLTYYLGIVCEVDTQQFNKYGRLNPLGIQPLQEQRKNIVKRVKIQPRLNTLTLTKLQLYESFIKFNQYIQDKDFELARKALEYKQAAYFDNPFQLSSYPYPSTLQILINNAELNFHQNDFITTINKGKQFLALCSGETEEQEEEEDFRWKCPSTPNTIPVYLLMMKCFSKFSQQKFNQMLKQSTETAIYNYGEGSSVIVTILSFAGISFSNGSNFERGFFFLNAALKNGVKVYENHNQIKISELCLDIGRMLYKEGKDFEAAKYLAKCAEFIFTTEKENSAAASSQQFIQHKLNFLIHQLELSMKTNQTFTESFKNFQKLENFLKNFLFKNPMSTSNIIINFNTQILTHAYKDLQQVGYQLGLKFNQKHIYQKSIEELWEMGALSSKILAVQFAYKLIAKQYDEINNQYEEYRSKHFNKDKQNASYISQQSQQRFSTGGISKERALLILQEKKELEKGNEGVLLVELISQGFQDEDEELITAVFRLVPESLVKIYQTLNC